MPKATGFGVETAPLMRVLDANASANNSAFSANTSLLKALGFTPTYTGVNATIQADGAVQFSTGFNFDFTPENGIDSNAIDFLGVAIHEIGDALGFRSGVDTYDGNTNFGGSLEGFAIFTVWDMFRYSTQSTALGVSDWAIGGTVAAGNAPYFSIDGGTTIFQSPEGPPTCPPAATSATAARHRTGKITPRATRHSVCLIRPCRSAPRPSSPASISRPSTRWAGA